MAATFGVASPLELHPSLLLHVQYSRKMLNVPVRIKQKRSSPTMPGSPMYAQLRKYRHSPLTVADEIENKEKFVIQLRFGCHWTRNRWKTHLFDESSGTSSVEHLANAVNPELACNPWSIMCCCRKDRSILDRNRSDIPSIWLQGLQINEKIKRLSFDSPNHLEGGRLQAKRMQTHPNNNKQARPKLKQLYVNCQQVLQGVWILAGVPRLTTHSSPHSLPCSTQITRKTTLATSTQALFRFILTAIQSSISFSGKFHANYFLEKYTQFFRRLLFYFVWQLFRMKHTLIGALMKFPHLILVTWSMMSAHHTQWTSVCSLLRQLRLCDRLLLSLLSDQIQFTRVVFDSLPLRSSIRIRPLTAFWERWMDGVEFSVFSDIPTFIGFH